nr:MAG TPA: capsid assembly protein [Caudoviricetes sp.]
MNEAMEVSTYNEDNQGGLSTLNNEVFEGSSTLADTSSGEEEVKAEEQQSQQQGEEQPAAKKSEEPSIPAPQTQKDADATLRSVGLDIREFETEFMANGELSPESYKKLTDSGIPKEVVDSYIKGQEALAERMIHDVHAIAGGSEGYADMVEWARGNLSPEEISAFDHIMAGGNKELIVLAVTGVVSRWKAATGSAPRQLTHGKASAGRGRPVDVFESADEVVQAINDPRYKRGDAAYIRSIERKMGRSKIFEGY